MGRDQGADPVTEPPDADEPDVSSEVSAAEPDTNGSFRQAMRRHSAGVCIVGVGRGDEVHGMAVTAATSFSMDPPSVLVCVNGATSVAPILKEAERFVLTLLARHHEFVAKAFSSRPNGRPRFFQGDWRIEADEPPWLADAPANLLCQVEKTLSYGSHIAIVGRVLSVRLGPDAPALIYRDGQFG